MTRDEVISELVDRKVKRDRAVQYADAFLEYREASENIERNGVIVAHPRTGAPMPNPYVRVRDAALKKLSGMRDVPAAFLW
jgi:phage terminase small subunit